MLDGHLTRFLSLLLGLALLIAGCSSDDADDAAASTDGEAATVESDTASSTSDSPGDTDVSAATPTSAESSETTTDDDPATSAEPVSSRPTAACSVDGPADVDGELAFTHDGVERWYLLAVAEASEPGPLLLDLHGYTEGATIHAAHTNLGADGTERGFTVVTPHGESDPVRWAFDPAGADLTYFDALLDDVGSKACFDRSQVVATGLSNGAMMSSILGCQGSGLVRAVAPVAGVRTFDNCPIETPVPMLAFHGTEDTFVTWEGGLGAGAEQLPNPDGEGSVGDAIDEADTEAAAALEARSVPEHVADWARQNGCASAPQEDAVSQTVTLVDYDCPDGADVRLFRIEGGGHTWPGSDFLATPSGEALVGATTFDISANDEILDFFESVLA